MILLYVLFGLLLLSALGVLAIPFIRSTHSVLSKDFIAISIITILFSVVLYQSFGQTSAVRLWFTEGKNHYNLMIELQQLGGIEGIITRLQDKLSANPNDAKGWFILGKLYYSKHDYEAARAAFAKAHELKPDDAEINRYYNLGDSIKN